MKVEFCDNELFGPILKVEYKEFKKAEKNQTEMVSLMAAVESYASFFDANWEFSENIYHAIVYYLKESGIVIFSLFKDIYNNTWCEAFVSNNNIPQKILYVDDNDYSYKRAPDQIQRGKFNPNAINKIRERHEAEGKENERNTK